MGARQAFVSSRTQSGANSNRFQIARHANNSFLLILCRRKDSQPKQNTPDPPTGFSRSVVPTKRKGGS